MATIGYGICLVISGIVVLVMARKSYENIDIYYWTLVALNPIIIAAYWIETRVSDPQAAYAAICFIYFDSTILLTVLIFSMLRAIGVKPSGWIKAAAYSAAFLHLGMVWLCMNNQLYYSVLRMEATPYGYYAYMEDGPLKIIHYVYLGVIMAVTIGIMIAGYLRKGTYSRKSLNIYTIITSAGIGLYVIETVFRIKFSLLPYLYTAAACIIAHNYDSVHAHDITSLISTHYDTSHQLGYASVSLNGNFLSCNPKCFEFMPFLKKQRIDEPVNAEEAHGRIIRSLIRDFESGENSEAEFKAGNRICRCSISPFSVRKDGKTQGYLLEMRDATKEKEQLENLKNFNEKLNEKVAENTEHIKNIQRSVVLGMADMIENRDSNTGGHVKRTSDAISILVDEIRSQGKIPLSDQLAADIVRAAPMHDLGKLQIDSSILCKPGKLTDEEYAVMKTHSTKSGEMVKIILEGVEEPAFVQTAYHIARYHHERWDGKGYPEGLVGEMIPLEARIMAVADVYDALVSKRVYKEPMSFEKAAEIMYENMGTQFDPNMRQVFRGCREALESYYSFQRD